jgi:hypothetical protein
MLRNQVGISNDLASGDNNFTDAGQLVRCHDNEVTL